jgi:non-heme chloroperoxidase
MISMKRRIIFASLLTLIAGSVRLRLHADDKIKEGFATTTAGVRIHYLQSGDGSSSSALVLIPGWRLPAFLWNEQLARFALTNRVVAIDPRSQGESTKTADGNTPESRGRDLHEALAQLKISKCVLVGWSQGAQDVAAYLQQFGTGSVAGIVLVDSPVSYGPTEVDAHKEFTKAILSNVSDVQKEMAASTPAAKLVVIDRTAHAVFVDDPAAFAAALESFLQSLPGWSLAPPSNSRGE